MTKRPRKTAATCWGRPRGPARRDKEEEEEGRKEEEPAAKRGGNGSPSERGCC
jgi:hypothetical protein